ncbi:MAG: ABC transporter ATP-binding protein/permease [Bifidobacteriaceae bacterium]|jgi:ATP-binding cassette subfamily B protein|nr:ABC transporter ATP-binding protein/permease [Bifidobacteriaceae bacterium]
MIRRLLAFSNPQARRLIRRVVPLMVVAAVLQGAAFVALVPFLEALLTGDGSIWRWLGALVAIGAAYAAVSWVISIDGTNAGSQVVASLLEIMGDRLVQLPIGWFSTDRAGELSDLASRGAVFTSAAPYAILRPLIAGFVTPVTVLVGALAFDWRVGATMAATAPIIYLAYRRIAAKVGAADRAQVEAGGEAAGRVIEFAKTQPALRAAGDNAIVRNMVDDALRQQHRASRRLHLTGGAAVGLFGATVYLAVVAVIVVGSALALDGSLTMPQTIGLLVLAVRFAEPIANSGALGGGVTIAENTLDQIQRLVDSPTLPEPAKPASPADHSVRFDHVTFGYGADPVLRDLSFEAPAGQVTALVGPSGSGKTTITRLAARFYDPNAGQVLIGGVALPELGSRAVSDAVAPVFQDVYLFDGSILDNIWLGRPEAKRSEVEEAGRRAQVDEIVQRLPGGWDTPVGEGGTNLSGGERQRVSIARALLKDAPIVLLDEATSALDIEGERAVQAAFDQVRQGRTVIVVAHRMTTIAAADQVILLNAEGQIAERGGHAELLAAGGAYARHWGERAEAAGWRLASTTRKDNDGT